MNGQPSCVPARIEAHMRAMGLEPACNCPDTDAHEAAVGQAIRDLDAEMLTPRWAWPLLAASVVLTAGAALARRRCASR